MTLALDPACRRDRGWPDALATPGGLALLAAAFSLAFRLPTLTLLPAWGDEVVTIDTLTLSPLELVRERLQHGHAPTYFLLLQALGLDGGSLFLLRLPSALADSLGAAVTALLAFRLGGLTAAIALAVLYAAMPILLQEAQDARPYALFFASLSLLLWVAAPLLDCPRLAAAAWRKSTHRAARRLRRLWLLCALAATAAIALLPLGLVAVAAVDLAVLWRARCSGTFRRLWFRQRLLTLLALSPLLYGYAVHLGRFAGDYWYAHSPALLLRTLRIADGAGVEYDPNLFLGYWGNRLLLALFLLLAGLGVIRGRRRPGLSLVLALAFGTQLLLLAISQHTPLYAPRYFAVATPALALLAGLGFAALWQSQRGLALAAGFGLAFLLSLQSLDAMHQLGKPRIDRAIARLTAAGVGQLGYFAPTHHLAGSLRHSLRDGPHGLRLAGRDVLAAAQRGLLVWVVDVRRVPHLWRHGVDFAGLHRCAPKVRGLHILAIARVSQDLAASCPGTRR